MERQTNEDESIHVVQYMHGAGVGNARLGM